MCYKISFFRKSSEGIFTSLEFSDPESKMVLMVGVGIYDNVMCQLSVKSFLFFFV